MWSIDILLLKCLGVKGISTTVLFWFVCGHWSLNFASTCLNFVCLGPSENWANQCCECDMSVSSDLLLSALHRLLHRWHMFVVSSIVSVLAWIRWGLHTCSIEEFIVFFPVQWVCQQLFPKKKKKKKKSSSLTLICLCHLFIAVYCWELLLSEYQTDVPL